MEHSKVKTRDLTIYKYFETLQLEYIVTELRKKIYPSLSDQDYYQRVMDQKKEKIEDIASRNNLLSIFNDKKTKKFNYSQIYNAYGLPNFLYKDEEHRKKFEQLDKKYYYFPKSEVRITVDGEPKIGKIESVDFLKNKAIVIVDEENYDVSLDHIARIL